MGLFSDKCVKCGAKVWKGSRVCPQCGANAPNTIIKCPACNKEVSTGSNFCWNCKTQLSGSARMSIHNNHWVRIPGDFATKIDTKDLEGLLRKKLTVEYGTKALLFQEQEFKGVLPPGEYDLGGFFKAISNLELKVPSYAVLIDAGDVIAEIDLEKVGTKDKTQAGVLCCLVLRLEESGALKFVENILKGKEGYRVDELESYLRTDVEDTVRAFIEGYSIKELANDPEGARWRFETRLKETQGFRESLERAGLSLVHVEPLRLRLPEEYKELENEEGALALESKKIAAEEARKKLAQRLRAAELSDKTDELDFEAKLKAFIREIEHEELKQKVMDDAEIENLTQDLKHAKDKQSVLHRIEIEEIESEAIRRKARLDFLDEEEKKTISRTNELKMELETAKTEYEKEKLGFEIEKIKNDLDWIEAQRGMELIQMMKKIKREDESERARMYKEMFKDDPIASLLSILKTGSEDRFEKWFGKQAMSPEEMALGIVLKSPDKLGKLLECFQSASALSDERVEQIRKALRGMIKGSDEEQFQPIIGEECEITLKLNCGHFYMEGYNAVIELEVRSSCEVREVELVTTSELLHTSDLLPVEDKKRWSILKPEKLQRHKIKSRLHKKPEDDHSDKGEFLIDFKVSYSQENERKYYSGYMFIPVFSHDDKPSQIILDIKNNFEFHEKAYGVAPELINKVEDLLKTDSFMNANTLMMLGSEKWIPVALRQEEPPDGVRKVKRVIKIAGEERYTSLKKGCLLVTDSEHRHIRNVLLYSSRVLKLGRNRERNDIVIRVFPYDKKSPYENIRKTCKEYQIECPTEDKIEKNYEDTQKISKEHCVLEMKEDGLFLKDLGINEEGNAVGTPCGTFVNDRRLRKTEEVKIEDGNCIGIADGIELDVAIFDDPPIEVSAIYNYMGKRNFDEKEKTNHDNALSISGVRLRRMKNVEQEEYILIIRSVTIGGGKEACIQLPRNFIGDARAEIIYCESLFWLFAPEGMIRVQFNKEESSLQTGDAVKLLPGMKILLGKLTLEFGEFKQITV